MRVLLQRNIESEFIMNTSIVFLFSNIFLFLFLFPTQTSASIMPPHTLITCTVNDIVLHDQACLDKECLIKAYKHEALLKEGTCLNEDCTKEVTKEDVEQAYAQGPYHIGTQNSDSYYMQNYMELAPSTFFPPFEVLDNICKEDLSPIKEWLTGVSSPSYIEIEKYTQELEDRLNQSEIDWQKGREPLNKEEIYSLERKGDWARVEYKSQFDSYIRQKLNGNDDMWRASNFRILGSIFLVFVLPFNLLVYLFIFLMRRRKRRKQT